MGFLIRTRNGTEICLFLFSPAMNSPDLHAVRSDMTCVWHTHDDDDDDDDNGNIIKMNFTGRKV